MLEKMSTMLITEMPDTENTKVSADLELTSMRTQIKKLSSPSKRHQPSFTHAVPVNSQ